MTLTTSQVLLYVADSSDYQIALGAAGIAGIPASNVIGDFATAWGKVASGSFLVIAVGGNAHTALYYNPCGWAGHAAGSTPFDTATTPRASLPGANYYLNGAGATAQDTLKLTAMLAYYAIHGSYPAGYGSVLPKAVAAVNRCNGTMYPSVTCPC